MTTTTPHSTSYLRQPELRPAADGAPKEHRRHHRTFNRLWGGAYSPTTDTAQSGPQRPIKACLDMPVPVSLIRLVVHLRRLHVPQVDVQTLDFFDQQENRLSGRAKLLIVASRKTRAPGAELLDLAFIQTIAQRSVHQGLAQCTTP